MTHKKAKNHDEAWELQETFKDKPHGWIQWKGTDVCMDIHCSCGALTHIDDDFCYVIQCPECKRVWFVNGHIELVEITEIESIDIGSIKIPQS